MTQSVSRPVDAGAHGLLDYDNYDRMLSRGLGVGAIVFMVVAAAAPMSVVAGSIPVLVAASESTGTPLFYLVATLVLVVFSIGYVTLSRFVRNAGAFYSYIQAGLGRLTGVGSAILAVLSYLALTVAVYAYFGLATSNLISTITGASIPWWIFAIACVALVAYLGFRDITLSSKVLGFVLIAETAIVVALDAVVIGSGGGPEGLSLESLNPVHLGDPGASIGIMLAILGFIGFEATAVFRHEAKNPDRTIPRATYISAISIGLFYCVSAWAILSAVGPSNAVAIATADPEGFVLNIGQEYLGSWFYMLMQVFLVTSTFACALAFHNVLTRYGFALARNRIVHRSLAAVHGAHKSPARSSIMVSIVSAVLMIVIAAFGLDPLIDVYTPAVGLATLAYLVLMGLTSVSVIAFFARGKGRSLGISSIKTLWAPAVAAVSFAVITLLVIVNIELLVGDALIGAGVIGAAVLAFAVGVGIAIRMRMRRPQMYEDLLDV